MKQMAQIQWLVEIRGERLGPMPTQQIVHRLMRREIKVVHRVSETGDGWVAICNEPVFEQYISGLIEQVADQVAKGSMEKAYQEKMNLENDDDATVVSKDPDELSGVFNMSAIKQGISEQLSHAKELQQASQNLTLLRDLLSDIRIKRKVVIVADDKPTSDEDEIHPDDKDEYVLTPKNFKDYVSSGSSKFLVSLLVLACLAWLGVQWKEQREMEEELAFQQAQQEAQMKNKYQGKLGNESEIMDMSPEDLLKKANQMLGDQKVSVWSLAGTAKNGQSIQLQMVRPDNFKEQGEVFHALNKKAYEFLLGGQLEKAEEFLLKSLALFSEEKHIAILLLTETALLFNRADSSSLSQIRMKEVMNIIARYREVNDKASTKLFIAEMAILHTLNEKTRLKSTLSQFLKVHPRGEKEDATIGYLQKASWTGLLPHCINIYSSNNTDSEFSAMLAGCLVRTPSAGKAEPYIYYAYKKDPVNDSIKDLLGWVYLEVGQYEKAKKIMWDPSVPSFKVSPYLTYSRIEF